MQRGELIVPSKDVVKKRLIFTWRNALQADQNPEETKSKPHKAYFSESGGFLLSREGIDAFDQIINELITDEEVQIKFSKRYLERIVDEVILKLMDTPEKKIEMAAEKQVIALFEKLSAPAVDWVIILPIANFYIEMEELEVGQIRLFRFKENDEKKVKSRIMRTFHTPVPQTELSIFLDKALESFVGKICAELTVTAVDHYRAEEIGMQSIDMVLDALSLYGARYNLTIPFYSEMYKATRHRKPAEAFGIQFSSTGVSISPVELMKGFVRPFNVSKEAMKNMLNDGFNILCGILKRNERDWTLFEKDLLTSIRFFALSTHEQPVINAFVNSVISLEALLVGEHESIVDNLAERVAFIIGKNLIERNWFFDQMVRLYRIRCSIVHSGDTDIELSDFILLQKIINYECITNMLNSYKSLKIHSTGEFIKWIRDRKFR